MPGTSIHHQHVFSINTETKPQMISTTTINLNLSLNNTNVNYKKKKWDCRIQFFLKILFTSKNKFWIVPKGQKIILGGLKEIWGVKRKNCEIEFFCVFLKFILGPRLLLTNIAIHKILFSFFKLRYYIYATIESALNGQNKMHGFSGRCSRWWWWWA
jgi:hypothetical protein